MDEAQTAVVLALHADQVADLGDVGRLLRAWPQAVGIQERAGPFHAVPAHGLFLATASQDQDAALFHLGDDGRLETAKGLLLGQFLQPGFLGHAGQAGFRATIAVALVVFDQPFAQ
ncbi:hypothetical protein D9M71_324900 [compost metagenome]